MESELSAMGIAQAHALATAMKAFELQRVFSSPLRRCMATAIPTADEFGLEVQEDPLLLEIAHGLWEGRLRDELAENDPERYRQWRHEPHIVAFEEGESVSDVLTRWQMFASSFVPRGDTLIVTHDAVVRVALVDLLRRDLSRFWDGRVTNGAFAWFTVQEGSWSLKEECVSAHLAGITADTSTQAL